MMSGGRGTFNSLPRLRDEASLTPSPANGGGSRWGHAFPAGAFLGVVQLDPHSEKLLADLVRAGEIPSIPGCLPLGDQPLDLGIDGLRELDDVQDAVCMPEHRHCSGALVGRRLSRLEPRVEGLDEFEEMTYRRRQIEIVSKGIVPTRAKLGGRSGVRHATQPYRELIQQLDRAVA